MNDSVLDVAVLPASSVVETKKLYVVLAARSVRLKRWLAESVELIAFIAFCSVRGVDVPKKSVLSVGSSVATETSAVVEECAAASRSLIVGAVVSSCASVVNDCSPEDAVLPAASLERTT